MKDRDPVTKAEIATFNIYMDPPTDDWEDFEVWLKHVREMPFMDNQIGQGYDITPGKCSGCALVVGDP